MKLSAQLMLATLCCWLTAANAGTLIVVEDRGGTSALPYYQGLAPAPQTNQPPPTAGVRGTGAYPVRTPQLSPGQLQGRVINAPGLQPVFLVGDDPMSRAWLLQRREDLQRLQAVGLAVNVDSEERLMEIRRWAGGLPVNPTPAGDLAGRLGLRHYPALLTPTAIQQ